MKEILLSQVYQHAQLSNQELQEIFDAHKKTEYTKGDFIIKEGGIANEYLILNNVQCQLLKKVQQKDT